MDKINKIAAKRVMTVLFWRLVTFSASPRFRHPAAWALMPGTGESMASKKTLVIVTRKLPEAVETRMRELFDARLNVEDAPMSATQRNRDTASNPAYQAELVHALAIGIQRYFAKNPPLARSRQL